ncbi:MAG TPA: OmpH family outer membrane protein [bacterium]|nr:OmpH family outer membrane protein [bacterium]
MSRFGGMALVLAAALFLSGCAPQIGVVDTQRVLNESVRGLEYQKQLDDREKQMVAELAVLNGQVSQAELNARRASLLTELSQLRGDLENQLNAQLHDAAAQVARQDGLRIVIVKSSTVLGGRDVTQQVIDRLK